MKNLWLRSIFFGALISAPLTALPAQVNWLQSMVGSADDNAEFQLGRMGFRKVDSFASGYGRGGIWYNRSTGQCIQVVMANSRVNSAMDIGGHPRCRGGAQNRPAYGNSYPGYGNAYPGYGNAYPGYGNGYPGYGNGYNAPPYGGYGSGYGGGSVAWLNGLIGKGFNRAEEQLQRNGFRSVDSYSTSPTSYDTIWFNGAQCLRLSTVSGRLSSAVDIGRHPRCR